MADIHKLASFILTWEGGFVDDPLDRGGATNLGVTLSTWRQVGYDKTGDGIIDIDDLRLLTPEEVIFDVLKPHYWDRWKADRIESQSVANIVVDWVWGSGKHGITNVQALLGVTVDGIVGEKTLAAINAQEPRQLFDRIKRKREEFIENLVRRNPTQKVFRAGWLRRLSYINYGSLTYNAVPPTKHSFTDI